jgi:hypothetical protein
MEVGESMTLTLTEQKVLDCICIRGGGVDIHEAMNSTGLSYTELLNTTYKLIGKGYEIQAHSFGNYSPGDRFSGWIKRLYLSPYDSKHKDLINQEELDEKSII